ncbi:RDD family protein [Bacteriovoracaceae bacterium]|nr:RDD family protein [Bacteriovoracaceae bacterium]
MGNNAEDLSGQEDKQFKISQKNEGQEEYAVPPFWRRFCAATLDGMIFGIINAPIAYAPIIYLVVTQGQSGLTQQNSGDPNLLFIQLGSQVLSVVTAVMFYGWFYKKKGATPGKALMGLKVLHMETGIHIGFGRTFVREVFGKIFGAIFLGLGFIWGLFQKEKRCWHDYFASTRVVYIKKKK